MPVADRRLADYVHRNEDAIALVLKTPFPADSHYRPFFRTDNQEKMHNMPDQKPDPIRDNANRVISLANEHRPPDTLLDRPTDSVTTLPSSIKRHERDLNGNTTYIKLGGS